MPLCLMQIQENGSSQKDFIQLYAVSHPKKKRRIVASVVSVNDFDALYLGFENHLNVFHNAKHGLTEELAYGLALYLNSTAVDDYFRRFSGHTQVNATDLRLIKYPDRTTLVELGKWAKTQKELSQEQIDNKIKGIQ